MASQDSEPSIWRPALEMGGYMAAETLQSRLRKGIRGARLQTGLNTRAGVMGSGKLKPWSTFQAEITAGEAGIESLAKKRAFRNQATRMFGASRVEALLSRGLGIANVMYLAPMLYGMSYHGFKGIQRLGFELERPELGGHMTLNSMAFTDRQRSMQAMHNSEFNGRSSMGQEAFLLHQ